MDRLVEHRKHDTDFCCTKPSGSSRINSGTVTLLESMWHEVKDGVLGGTDFWYLGVYAREWAQLGDVSHSLNNETMTWDVLLPTVVLSLQFKVPDWTHSRFIQQSALQHSHNISTYPLNVTLSELVRVQLYLISACVRVGGITDGTSSRGLCHRLQNAG